MLLKQPFPSPAQPVVSPDGDTHQLAPRARRDARGPADQALRRARSRHRDDDALLGLPGPLDPVTLAILRQIIIHPVSEPEQGELAKGSEVARPEEVGQGRIDAIGRIDVAVGKPATKGLGRHVDELDLLGGANDGVRDRLALHDAGDGLDHVVDALEVLEVQCGDDIDARIEQDLDILPPLLVKASRRVGVGELVDQHHLRCSLEDGLKVHLFEGLAPVGEVCARQDVEVGDLLGRVLATVGLDIADHHVRTPLLTADALGQHLVGLAHAGSSPEVDPKPPSAHQLPPPLGTQPIDRDVELENVDARLTKQSRDPGLGVLIDRRRDRGSIKVPGTGHSASLKSRIGDRDLRVKT